jgi:hypothetical protein
MGAETRQKISVLRHKNINSSIRPPSTLISIVRHTMNASMMVLAAAMGPHDPIDTSDDGRVAPLHPAGAPGGGREGLTEIDAFTADQVAVEFIDPDAEPA